MIDYEHHAWREDVRLAKVRKARKAYKRVSHGTCSVSTLDQTMAAFLATLFIGIAGSIGLFIVSALVLILA